MVRQYSWIVVLVASAAFLGTCVSPPGLMDDVDAVQAQISRTMLETGDWITPRLNGVVYLEKPPLKYWLIAGAFAVFGVHDWAARLPIALGIVLLCWMTFRFGVWAFSPRAGLYAGLSLSTCVGLFLFSRILIADPLVTLSIAAALWGFLRALDDDEPRPRRWAWLMWASVGAGILFKGLIAVVFPVAIAGTYLVVTRRVFSLATWKRLHPASGAALLLAIAAPWHLLAILRNPPYLDFTMTSGPGQFRGFFWFYFMNEHVLRFLGRRFPRDYNTVPRLAFWGLHLAWLFPWSVFFPAAARQKFTASPESRAEAARLLALVWIGIVMVFFTFSTTQEYYSMPIYPALALLIGAGIDGNERLARFGRGVLAALAGLGAIATGGLLFLVRNLPNPGDISNALRKSADVYGVYTLSLGHMGDLTLASFAYLRGPLALATAAFVLGAVGVIVTRRSRLGPYLAAAVMMVLFFTAARMAMVTFEPYLGSRPLAETLRGAPPGGVIVDDQYYLFSSVFFYANPSRALLLNGRKTNLEYGSNAPGAPDVFIDDTGFARLWTGPERWYLLIEKSAVPRLAPTVGAQSLILVRESGGKCLFTNH